MKTRIWITLACTLCFLIAPIGSQAQSRSGDLGAEFARAQRLISSGDHAGAEAAFGRILAERPGDIDALLGRGHARAFQKKYAEARADFSAVLKAQPDHLGALIGLAHAYAWAAQYGPAMARFERALALAPKNVDAQRGAAFTELWRGNAAAAAARFERLLQQVPQDAGAKEGLAQARKALAGAPAPSSEQPRAQLPAPGGMMKEVSLWVGRSQLPGSTTEPGVTETGLRLVEVALWPTDSLRLFARYDDGLSRDNAAIALANQSAALTSVGTYWRWHERLGTSLEYGERELPNTGKQKIYRFEQSVFLDGGHVAKLGGWRGPRDDQPNDGKITEWLWYAGLSYAVTDAWRIEPTYFSSRSGVHDDGGRRLLLATNYDLGNGWELGGGAAYGRVLATGVDSLNPEVSVERAVREGFLRASVRLSERLRLHLLGRREPVKDGDAISVISLGATFSWR